MNDCDGTIEQLHQYGIGSILDYSVEGKEDDKEFEHTTEETILTIKKAHNNPRIPFCVFKVTGLARFNLLAKINAKEPLSTDEQKEFDKVAKRVQHICHVAYENQVRLLIDAEEFI